MLDKHGSIRKRPKRRIWKTMLISCLAVAGIACGLARVVRSQSKAQQSVTPYPARLSLKAEGSGTVSIGQETTVRLALLDQFGKPTNAPWNLAVTLIATTLDSGNSAKKWLDSNASKQSQTDRAAVTKGPRVVLQAGQQAARIAYTLAQKEGSKTIGITSLRKGRVLLFAESQNLAPGETTLIVVDKKYEVLPKRSVTQVPIKRSELSPQEVPALVPIRWQEPSGPEYWLEITPPKPTPFAEGGVQYAQFEIALRPQAEAGEDYLRAPTDIIVMLKVMDGNATVAPSQLTIPTRSARSEGTARLACLPGGSVSVTASPVRIEGIRIHKDTKEVVFEPGIRTTTLKLRAHPDSALANGLDAITITAETLQQYEDREEARRPEARTPEDEGMTAGRIVSFSVEGGSQGTSWVSETGGSEITIPKDKPSGSIKLLGRRSTSSLKIVATTTNGKTEQIESTEDLFVSFSFPWLALTCALFGGLLFPFFQRNDVFSKPDKKDLGKLAWGAVLGGVVFVLALFGALSSDPHKIESLSVTITKLPTEQPMAALVIGFLGSAFWGGAFVLGGYIKSRRANAKLEPDAAKDVPTTDADKTLGASGQ